MTFMFKCPKYRHTVSDISSTKSGNLLIRVRSPSVELVRIIKEGVVHNQEINIVLNTFFCSVLFNQISQVYPIENDQNIFYLTCNCSSHHCRVT
jgi:hypothetical protein